MVKISVIVPVYNCEQVIFDNMTNLLNQSYKDYEVIFINDGSTDHTKDVLDNVHQDNVTIIHQQNLGQAQARNRGLQLAKGEFICFVDIDDRISVHYLEELYSLQLKENADIVWCNANVYRDSNIIGFLDNKNTFIVDEKKNYFLHNTSPWRKLIRKSILLDHQLFFPKLRYYEDLAVMPVVGLYTKKISYLDKALYDYILHEGSTMNQVSYNKKLEDIFASIEMLKVSSEKTGIMIKKELEFLYIDHLLHAASLRFFQFRKYDQLEKICLIMKEEFPDWDKNEYYRKKSIKYKIVCKLFYGKKYSLLSILLGRK